MSIKQRLNLRVIVLTILLAPISQIIVGEVAAQTQSPKKTEPATNEDIAIYQAMGTSFFCLAALDGVEFPKALGISASTYAQALKGRHGGKVASLKGKVLTNKEMFAAAEHQLLLRAISVCPDGVPEDVKEKVQDIIKNKN